MVDGWGSERESLRSVITKLVKQGVAVVDAVLPVIAAIGPPMEAVTA